MKAKKLLITALNRWFSKPENLQRWKQNLNVQKRQAKTFEKIKKTNPEAYIPLRLACSVYLTQGSNNRYVKLPVTFHEFLRVWEEIKPLPNETKKKHSKRFKAWLNSRGNYLRAGKFGNYFSEYFSESDPITNLKELLACTSLKETKKFWKQFRGVGTQYSKNLIMDEMNPISFNSIKIDARLNTILKGTDAESLNNHQKEVFFLEVGKEVGLNGWQIDRLCYRFNNEIIDLMY